MYHYSSINNQSSGQSHKQRLRWDLTLMREAELKEYHVYVCKQSRQSKTTDNEETGQKEANILEPTNFK